MNLPIKIESIPRAVLQLVNRFNCLSYDWTVKDECYMT
jgi:hypothetical protein